MNCLTDFGGIMKQLILNFLIFTVLASVPAFAQQGTVPGSHTGGLSWGWLMTLGLIAGMMLGWIVRPRKINRSDRIERHDRAA
jgi:hypothetical protein